MKIHQEIIFKANVQKVFAALTLEKIFAEFSGMKADLKAQPGEEFSLFGVFITGKTLEVVTDKLLVQEWRSFNWDADIYSTVRFALKPINENETLLIFDQSDFPESEKAHLEEGWNNKYWEPMRLYFKA